MHAAFAAESPSAAGEMGKAEFRTAWRVRATKARD